ncbi:hypothetical protein [Candidatus Magnetobacterium casense]|uniref:Secreted protein n=1 Tax=Candidatus Magnetobacterium casense TaxID=1455061 RepID=A0ABS6S1Q9_9BACT|nr:hypothetical protein [Candidatus Magnetobacterium casensis]MBV6342778.1 hypothetical protein [Candidatus Magnetobacterium casensis]
MRLKERIGVLTLAILLASLLSCSTHKPPSVVDSEVIGLPAGDYLIIKRDVLSDLMDAAVRCKFELLKCEERMKGR